MILTQWAFWNTLLAKLAILAAHCLDIMYVDFNPADIIYFL